ncbi:TAT-binding protein-like protein 7, AAA ATPase [Microbotryomycetes sp. JL201]|nr:TAT-binding protein-like protein 7, AAA ATPase [Microbotryomycetes sp. JL201]
MATAATTIRAPLRPRPSSQSLGQASTTDASSREYVTARSSLHSHDEDSSDYERYEHLRASCALPRSETLSSSVDNFADATYTQHDVSHMHDISAMSAGVGLSLPQSQSFASFASRSTLSSEPHELFASAGLPPFVKSAMLQREDTARALHDTEDKMNESGPKAVAPALRSAKIGNGTQTAILGECFEQANTKRKESRIRLPARDVKPAGFPMSTSILATELSLKQSYRDDGSGQDSSENTGSTNSSLDGHRTISDVDLDLSFDLPQRIDLEGFMGASSRTRTHDAVADLRTAFRAAESGPQNEIAANADEIAVAPGTPRRSPLPRSMSSSPRMARKLPAPLFATSRDTQPSHGFVHNTTDSSFSWREKGKWKASQRDQNDDMNVLEFVVADERDWRSGQAANASRDGFSPQTSPLFDHDSQGSTRTTPTTPNDTPVMPEHDHQAISDHADEEYQRLLKHKGPIHGLGFNIEQSQEPPLSPAEAFDRRIPFLSVTAPQEESDDESGTEESAVDPTASPSRRLSNRLSRSGHATAVSAFAELESARVRERNSARCTKQARHLLRSETMPGARLPHEKAADSRFAFKPVPLQLVVDHCPPAMAQTTRHMRIDSRRQTRPLSVISLLDMATYPAAILDETPPAKLTLWLGFILGPWLWIIGGWYLRGGDGELPGTQGIRCHEAGCKCGRLLSRMKLTSQHFRHGEAMQTGLQGAAARIDHAKWMGMDEWVFWNRVAGIGVTPDRTPAAVSPSDARYQQPEQYSISHRQSVPHQGTSSGNTGVKISTASWLSKYAGGSAHESATHTATLKHIGESSWRQDQSFDSATLLYPSASVISQSQFNLVVQAPSHAQAQSSNSQPAQAMNPYDMHAYGQAACANSAAAQSYPAYAERSGGDSGHNGAARPARKGRPVIKDSEDEDEDAEGEVDQPYTAPVGDVPMDGPPKAEDDEFKIEPPKLVATLTKSGRKTLRPAIYDGDSSDEDDEPVRPAKSLRRGRNRSGYGDGNGFVEPDDEFNEDDLEEDDQGEYGLDRKTRLQRAAAARRAKNEAEAARSHRRPARSTRNSARNDPSFEADESPAETTEDEVDLEISSDDSLKPPAPRKLREKPKIDYYAIPPVDALTNNKSKKKKRGDDPFAGLPHNLTGAQWAALYPDKGNNGDSSSSDDDAPGFSTPRKGGGGMFSSNAALAGLGAGGMFAGGAGLDLGAPSNLGKVGGSTSLADTDPLGVSQVSFDSVGGLGSHIQQLKEMVSLPLLYPEVFERFNMSPPRGVLFHAFFMRKGADCLSKWVGEAERQLRLLFEEAKKCQPSIIFFDEIDGLAPVRSSKQEQIHASIVSTLLALMDGMDGRGKSTLNDADHPLLTTAFCSGQVIVIGATNRPDAIDPALRRPGRFDREFYFPLPNIEGRRKIIDIHTKGWNPPLEDAFKDELAHLTKGYGGADLRALCTEAALNAVQRTFPQIYKTNDRLLIKPEKIEVTARDFIISQKNLIPSTARATSSLAAPLPVQLEPLLSDSLETAKQVLAKVLPEVKKVNVLEDAEWEDDGGGFEKEKMMQAFETLRVFRPRLLIHGAVGMGQGYVGSAVLHHLEGFHVQPLDLATLVADSTRTMEAACVQLFVEAKRHKPSILFIPSLITWCHSVGESVKSTIKGLLDGLDPSDPILLLAVVDGPLSEVPGDVRSWFGFVKGNRVAIGHPIAAERERFFDEVIKSLRRPPNEFPDAMPRRKRVLEKLPIAPPPPPKEPTEAEVKAQEETDQRLLEYLKWKLGPILNELKKRYKRFTRSFYSDWRNDDLVFRMDQQKREVEIVGLGTQPYFNVDLDTMHNDLYKGYYFTPEDFLADVLRIQANVEVNAILEHDTEAPVRAGQMINHARVMIDQSFDANFRAECVRVRERAEERENKLPPGAKGKLRKIKSKGPVPAGDDLYAYASAAAAAGGKGLMGTIKKSTENGEEQAEGGRGAEPDRLAKRVRIQMDEEKANDTDEAPPKRAKSEHGGASTSNGMRVNFVLNGAPAQPAGAFAAPMQVGAAPEDVIGLEMPPLPSLPDAVAPAALTPHLSSTVGASTSASESLLSTARQATPRLGTSDAAGSRPLSQSAAAASSSPAAVSDAPMPPATPDPLPEFVVPSPELTRLARMLKEDTADLTVDELEQMRAACFDVVWRGRKEWNRSQVVQQVSELVTEFVIEAREAKEFA